MAPIAKRLVWLGSVACLVLAWGCQDGQTGAPSVGQGASGSLDGGDSATLGDASSDTATDGDAAAVTVVKTNVGKVCASNADCALIGLKCFETNAATGAGICSKKCTGAGDCETGTFCNPQAADLICTPPRFCNGCTKNDECGVDGLCLTGSSGAKYCTRSCSFGDNTCPPAASCKQFGSSINEFACQPDYGKCVGDGAQCSPCAGQADCGSGAECYYSSATGERFCAKVCKTGTTSGCAVGFVCSQPKGAPSSICLKSVGKEVIATCAKGDKGFCEPCGADHECLSGRCALKNGKKFCVEPTPCQGNKDCPHGGVATGCVPSDNGKGTICSPPLSWGCQGYLACLAVNCNAGETCVAGLCKKSE
ncbi:MAG: hypothetical protein EXR77_15120 [Myxococcales bacterium]|nr:hypothetical protein [Myxococcales bacterium]